MIFRQIRTVVAAVRAVYADSGFAMAGAVAYSFILSLFPFCIFLAALAGVFGGEERAQEGVRQLFEIVPKPVAEALAAEVMAVMGRTRFDLVTYGALISLFFATSAIESLRAALNVAYRQKETRPYPVCLLQSSAFVVLSAVGVLALTWGVVVGPEMVARIKPTWLLWLADAGWLALIVRFVIVIAAIGGQLLALYPEKFIFDVAGFPRVIAKDFVKGMTEQALQFGCAVRLGEKVIGLKQVDEAGGIGHFLLETDAAEYPTRTLLIAAGIGAFEARKLPAPGVEVWEGRGLDYKVLDPKAFAGRRVLVVGGGDSAFDWVMNLADIATAVMLIHRRDAFRAHTATVRQIEKLQRAGKVGVRTFCEVKAIHGNERVEGVTLLDTKTQQEETLPFDAVLPQLGFHSDLGAIKEWGLDTEKADIKVDRLMATSVPGIYAAGDIASYEGKLKLIATGVAEACTAVNNAVHYIDPKRKVNPGHSSELKIFATQQLG